MQRHPPSTRLVLDMQPHQKVVYYCYRTDCMMAMSARARLWRCGRNSFSRDNGGMH